MTINRQQEIRRDVYEDPRYQNKKGHGQLPAGGRSKENYFKDDIFN